MSKNRKKGNAIFTIAVIAAIILIFAVAGYFIQDRLFSETENRMLAQKPEISADAVFDGSYAKAMEQYEIDQFAGRDKWMGIRTMLNRVMQKQEINGVYLCEDDYLIEKHLPEDYTDELVEEKLALLQKLVENWNASVMIVPTADNILTDKLPANAPYFDQKAFLDKAAALVGENYVDVYSTLAEHADEEIYYHTDHHWTSLGAYYGYQAWARDLGISRYPYNVKIQKPATEEFLGTLQSKAGVKWNADTINYFGETTKKPVKIVYDLTKEADSYYEPSYLEKKDKYGYFLDGNHALTEIETGTQGKGSLFIIKDSYANCFVPLLAPHYTKIYLLDPRYYNGRLFELLQEYTDKEMEFGRPLDVMVLYNAIHFLEDFKFVE